jgi:uncharacterized protein
MRAGRLPLDEQMACLRAALDPSRTPGEVLSGASAMNLPGWYLVAGCLYQTVWNVVTDQPPEAGILDYDLVYFDWTRARWRGQWPGLTVHPWPATADRSADPQERPR